MKKEKNRNRGISRILLGLDKWHGPFSEGSHRMLYFCNSCSLIRVPPRHLRVQFPCLTNPSVQLPFPLPARCTKCELFQGPTPPSCVYKRVLTNPYVSMCVLGKVSVLSLATSVWLPKLYVQPRPEALSLLRSWPNFSKKDMRPSRKGWLRCPGPHC